MNTAPFAVALGAGAFGVLAILVLRAKMKEAEDHRSRASGQVATLRALVDHLTGVARARGYGRLSLETGSGPAFAPARSLYASAGFTPCPPFGDYWETPNSTCMTLVLV